MRLTGLTVYCIEAVALCREYNFMLRKLQYFPCSLLHRRNISAGWSG
ncbi:RepA leader peptide Tap [Salmonella enterica]|nr:RepA leader peptide Tap [Salmonella enterica]